MTGPRGEVLIDLDRTRTLHFNSYSRYVFNMEYGDSWRRCYLRMLKSMAEEGLLDPNDAEVNKLVETARRIPGAFQEDRDLLLLLKSMLMHEEPLLTVEKTAALMDQAPGDTYAEKYLYVMRKVMEAISATSMRAGETGEEKKMTSATRAMNGGS